MILQRVRCLVGLAKIVIGKTIVIYDQDPVLLEVLNVHLERRRIHGHEYIHRVARRIDIARRELHLESAHTGERPRGRADFRRIVREGR